MSAHLPLPAIALLLWTLSGCGGARPPLRPLDEAAISHMMRGTQVLALGEPTHGSGGVFALKREMIRRLVTDHGVRVIAMELRQDTGAALDRYVRGGDLSLRALLSDSYFFMQCEEIEALMRWLRAYNLARPAWGSSASTPKAKGTSARG